MADEVADVATLREDAALWRLRRRYPRFDIFRAATGRGVRYFAYGTADTTLHTVITDDLGELAEVLAGAERLADECPAR